MSKKLPSLELGSINLDDYVNINIFSPMETDKSANSDPQDCTHFGYLVKDGHHLYPSQIIQRVKCSRCGKRFGNTVNEWNLYEYKIKLMHILYELFFEGCKQSKMSKRWSIPQSKLSSFKRKFVETIFQQHPKLVNYISHTLPRGVIYGDETYMGKMGNSNTEIVFCNDKFEILATGPVLTQKLSHSIFKTFFRIPNECREKLHNRWRIFIQDISTAKQPSSGVNSTIS